MEFIWQALRQVVFLLDQAVYSLIPSAYELIFYLANINIATNDVFVAIINRVYLLLGIFMLFKVSFSIMQYIVDPNAFSDKSKGFGKLITNALVSVVLLAMVPWIFATAYDLQNKIILSNVIPRVILGDTSYADYSEDNIDTQTIEQKQKEIHSLGVDVQFTIFSAFYNLNTTNNGGYTSCAPTTGHPITNVIGSNDMIKNETCWNEIQTPLTEEIHKQGGTLRGLFKYCNTSDCSDPDEPYDERDFATFKYLLWWMKDGGQSDFTINYTPIISTIVGGYLLLLLITFAIDIATRVFKLMFLQMVAPIAIISYVDPKESASNGRLHNWTIECVKTYVSLFLRLAVIYLAVQLIKLLTSVVFIAMTDSGSLYYNEMAPEGALNIFVYILLILGIFTFAKKLPQMIESIFNIKLSGDLNVNPFKSGTTLGALAGGAVGGALGSIGGAGANFLAGTRDGREKVISAFKNDGLSGAGIAIKNNARNLFSANGGLKVARNTVAGFASGGLRGTTSGFGRGKGTPGLKSGIQGKQAAIRGRQLKEQQYGLRARAEQAYNEAIGYRGKTAAETGIGNELKQARQEHQNWRSTEEQIRNTLATHAANYRNGQYASQIQMLTQTEQHRDPNGELTEERKYLNYEQFRSQAEAQLNQELIDRQAVANMYGVDIDHHELTAQQIEQAKLESTFADERQKVIDSRILDKSEFDNVTSMVDQQIHASTEANKLDSTIKRLESGQKTFKEKPKN